MSSFTFKVLGAAISGASAVAAHGHATGLVINGVFWPGYDPTSYPYLSSPPTVVGWTAGDTDNGYVAPDAFASGDIICHKDATNAGGYATVAAGDSIYIPWSAWPESHKGPVIDYLANCNGDCTTIDKTTLEFFKIDGVGLIDDTTTPGTWGSDQLIANNISWLVQIPSDIAPGQYVLRHEIIALHGAQSSDGAQNYPQCFNLDITGSGTDAPAGTLGEALYTETDAGILVNIYQSLASYVIPGPTMIPGATNVAQAASVITATSSALTSLSGATGGAAAVATTTSAASVATSSTSSSQRPATTSAVSVNTAAAAAATTSSSKASSSTSSVAAPTTTKKACNSSSKKARRHARELRA